ncbi:uncharacterized protein [Pseudorasbora parva]|uniref:uncharacterized protein n=1 Tax=Pseudorasbora parva TaxID=51549 RepID=UPI00351DE56E
MSASVSGKQKLNLVLCGSDTKLTVSVSKFLRGKKIKLSHQRESSEVCVKKKKIYGRLITLVELPALNHLSEEDVLHQTLRCMSLCDPGVHVFLHIIPDAPLNNDERADIDKIHKIFDSREHFMMLFTKEKAAVESVTDFVKCSPEFQSLIRHYEGPYRVIGLKESGNSRQIPELLDYMENMKTEPYSLQMYVKAQVNRARHEVEKKYMEKLSDMENKIQELQEKFQSEEAEYNQKIEEMKRRHENEIKDVMKKHRDEARKQAEGFHESTERKLKHVLELTEMIQEHQKQHRALDK